MLRVGEDRDLGLRPRESERPQPSRCRDSVAQAPELDEENPFAPTRHESIE